MSDQLNVGDVLITEHMLGESRFPITRATKTLAVSRRSDGYEHKFKRAISSNMSYPHERYDLTQYRVDFKTD